MRATLARGVPRATRWSATPGPRRSGPSSALYGLMIGTLFSGSFVVEVVTAWPGLGRLMVDALRARDIYLVAGTAAAGAACLAAATLVADVVHARLDPARAGVRLMTAARRRRCSLALAVVAVVGAVAGAVRSGRVRSAAIVHAPPMPPRLSEGLGVYPVGARGACSSSGSRRTGRAPWRCRGARTQRAGLPARRGQSTAATCSRACSPARASPSGSAWSRCCGATVLGRAAGRLGGVARRLDRRGGDARRRTSCWCCRSSTWCWSCAPCCRSCCRRRRCSLLMAAIFSARRLAVRRARRARHRGARARARVRPRRALARRQPVRACSGVTCCRRAWATSPCRPACCCRRSSWPRPRCRTWAWAFPTPCRPGGRCCARRRT